MTANTRINNIRIPHIHIIHVGSMANKGTYALVKSEISEIKKLYANARITISTDDMTLLRSLEPSFELTPPLVDIPYEQADKKAREKGYDRTSLRYRLDVILHISLMPLQALLTMISATLATRGFMVAYRPTSLEAIKGADLVISSADENFKEGSSYLPFNIYWRVTWWTILLSRMIDVIVAKRIFRKPVIVFPNSLGPFRTFVGKLMAKAIVNNLDLLMLRERHSSAFLDELKTRTPYIIVTDMAMLFQIDRSHFNSPLPRPIVGVCPGLYASSFSQNEQNAYVLAHSRMLDYLAEKYGYQIALLPHEITNVKKSDDLELSKAIIQNMRHKNMSRIIVTTNIEEFKYYLGQLDMLITSRMHPAVLACTDHVPTIMIAYDHKQKGFFSSLDLDQYVLDIKDTSYEKYLEKIELMLHNTDRIRKILIEKIPKLQKDLRMEIRKNLTKYIQGEY